MVAAIGPRRPERWMPDPDWDDLAGRLRHGPALVAMAAELDGGTGLGPSGGEAHSWAEILDRASELLEAQRRTAERDLGRNGGLGLGL